MTGTGPLEQIDVGGFDEWLPLRLDLSREDYVEWLLERFAGSVPPEVLDPVVRQVASVTADVAALTTDEVFVIDGWLLLPSGGEVLRSEGLVVFSARRIEPGTTASDFVASLESGVELYQPVLVEDLPTASGPARLVRMRSHETTDQGVEVTERVIVFWLPEGVDVAVMMTSMPMTDLVEAGRLALALVPLAESVQGL